MPGQRNSCSFCINSLLKKITCPEGTLKNYLRKNSVDRAIQELEDIISKYGKYITVFNFDDDLLMLYKNWMLEFTGKYEERIHQKYGITYAINASEAPGQLALSTIVAYLPFS